MTVQSSRNTDSRSEPGARSGSSYWLDENGLLWLFGGHGYSPQNSEKPTDLNDLWTYDTTSSKWTQIQQESLAVDKINNTEHRPSPRHHAAICGVHGLVIFLFGGFSEDITDLADTWYYFIPKAQWYIVNNLSSIPTPRGNAATWCLHDRLILFGGVDHEGKTFNDLWIFSIENITWVDMNGPNYGDEHAVREYPEGRAGAMTWFDKAGHLYMFGGCHECIRGQHHTSAFMSDLWCFAHTTNSWQLLAGTHTSGISGNYGKKGEGGEECNPGCRQGGSSWTDSHGDLWLFGGDGADKDPPNFSRQSKLLSDLWKYEHKNKHWTWVGGSDTGEGLAVYGTIGNASSHFIPGPRYETTTWTENGTSLFLFGGFGHDSLNDDGYLNDLWMVDISDFINDKPAHSTMFVLGICLLGLLALVLLSLIVMTASRGLPCSRHAVPTRSQYTVRYSPLSDSAVLE